MENQGTWLEILKKKLPLVRLEEAFCIDLLVLSVNAVEFLRLSTDICNLNWF